MEDMNIDIKLSNIQHNGHMCVNYQSSGSENVFEACRVDFSHTGEVIIKGKLSDDDNKGLKITFSSPVVSSDPIDICSS